MRVRDQETDEVEGKQEAEEEENRDKKKSKMTGRGEGGGMVGELKEEAASHSREGQQDLDLLLGL